MIRTWKGIPKSMQKAATMLTTCNKWTAKDHKEFMLDCILYKESIRCLKMAKKELHVHDFNKNMPRIDLTLSHLDRRM